MHALSEYGRFWSIHQLVPFIDKILGIAGAMDNRMVSHSQHCCKPFRPWPDAHPVPIHRRSLTPVNVPQQIAQPYDWYLRLPLVTLTLCAPHPWLLLVAHVVNIACWFERVPAVWDYMCWCALTEATFVGAALMGGGRDKVAARFLPAVRAQLIVLYMSAAFWKLTTSVRAPSPLAGQAATHAPCAGRMPSGLTCITRARPS